MTNDLDETNTTKSSNSNFVHWKFVSYSLLLALVGGILAQLGFEDCPEDESILASIGKFFILISSGSILFSAMILLRSLLKDTKRASSVLGWSILHTGGILLIVILFDEAIFSNVMCGVAGYAPYAPP